MFSKELEEVIDAALADGVITEKEREVLHKRAQAEGVDPDELDVVIDGRLAKTKKQKDWLRPTPPQHLANEKHGNVVKCPSCGAQVDRTKAICPECGYAFTNIKVVSSIKELYKKLEEADGGSAGGFLATLTDNEQERNKRIAKQRATIIANAPVPTTKEDILEFLSAAVPNATIVNPLTGTIMGRSKIAGIVLSVVVVLALIATLIAGGDGKALAIALGSSAGYGGLMAFTYIVVGGNASDNEHNKLASAWKSKCEQIVIKARFSLREDKKTLEDIEHYAQLIGLKEK